MRIAYEFKKQSEASDKHLRSFIQDVNNKFEQVTKQDQKNDDDIEDEIGIYEMDDLDTSVPISTQQVIKGKRKAALQSRTLPIVQVMVNKTISSQASLVEMLESNSQENDQYTTHIDDEIMEDDQQLNEIVIVDENGIEIMDDYRIDEQSSDTIEYQQDDYVTNDMNSMQAQQEEEDEEDVTESVDEVLSFEDEEHLDDDVSIKLELKDPYSKPNRCRQLKYF